jgi:hypothetical protein
MLHSRLTSLRHGAILLTLAISTAAPSWAAKAPQYPSPIVNGIVEGHASSGHLRHGVYDPVSNRTFVVYPGCHNSDPCHVDPYIKYFNHSTGSWSGNLRLGEAGTTPDSHYYPQILIDNQRYIHVFHGLHANAPIQHYKSTVTAEHAQILSSSRWQSLGFGAIDNHWLFNRATYPRAVKDASGKLYVFYRQTVKGGTGGGAPEDWFEPYLYVRSTNHGATWDTPRLLFVPATAAQCPSSSQCSDGDSPIWNSTEEWDTIYGLAHLYDPAKNGVHFMFSRNEFHNDFVDKNFYAFLDFDNLTVYDAAGNASGPFLTEDEMLAINRHYVFLDLPGAKTPVDDALTRAVISPHTNGIVTLYSNYRIAQDQRKIEEISWKGYGWIPGPCIAGTDPSCTIYSQWMNVGDAETFADGTVDLYFDSNYFGTSGQPVHDVVKAHRGPDGWDTSVLASQGGDFGFTILGRVESPHIETSLLYMEDHYDDWLNPSPTGKLFAWGSRDHVFAVKKQGASNSTEFQILDGAHSFKQWLLQTGTALGTTGTNQAWEFELGDFNGDGSYDVYAIAKTGTGSGMTEVHILDGATGYQTFLLHNATVLHDTGSDGTWDFEVGDHNNDGKLDVYGIKRTGTGSGKVEVHILNGATFFQSFLAQVPTYMGKNGTGTRWDYELGDYDGDGKLDLYCIDKLQSTAINRPKVHILSGATNFATRLKQQVLAIPSTDGTSRWNYETGDNNNDGVVDLYAIERSGTGNGKTTIHILDGLTEYQDFLLRTPTALGETGTDSAWEFMILP